VGAFCYNCSAVKIGWVRFIHKHKECITANMAVANSLQMLKTVIMDFSVIKPHFS